MSATGSSGGIILVGILSELNCGNAAAVAELPSFTLCENLVALKTAVRRSNDGRRVRRACRRDTGLPVFLSSFSASGLIERLTSVLGDTEQPHPFRGIVTSTK
jgi:hypothetical protein